MSRERAKQKSRFPIHAWGLRVWDCRVSDHLVQVAERQHGFLDASLHLILGVAGRHQHTRHPYPTRSGLTSTRYSFDKCAWLWYHVVWHMVLHRARRGRHCMTRLVRFSDAAPPSPASRISRSRPPSSGAFSAWSAPGAVAAHGQHVCSGTSPSYRSDRLHTVALSYCRT